MQNEKEGVSGRTTPDLALYWDSWDSVTRTPTQNTSIQHNDNVMQNSPSVHTNSAQDGIQQMTTENRSPPTTPSILKGRGT